jgi:hypothetical protein
MRQPASHRNVALMLVGACLVGMLVLAVVPEGAISKNTRVGLFMAGLIGASIAMVFSLIFAADARLYRQLTQGQGVLDRWRVTPELWTRFLEAQSRRAVDTKDYASSVYCYKQTWEGMEVIVGEKAVIVGTDFHRVPTYHGDKHLTGCNILVDGVHFAELLFFTVYNSKGGMRRVYEALRFPVPEDHTQSMLEVLKIYHGTAVAKADRRGLLDMYPRGFRNGSLVMVVLCAIAFGVGLYSNKNPGTLLSQPADAVVGIVGALVGLASLVFLVIAQSVLVSGKKGRRRVGER